MKAPKIVDFSKCQECVNFLKNESEEPCFSCLSEPTRIDSTTPVYFKKDKNKLKEEQKNARKRKKSKK